MMHEFCRLENLSAIENALHIRALEPRCLPFIKVGYFPEKLQSPVLHFSASLTRIAI